MTHAPYEKRSPEIARIIALLVQHHLRYVLTGSVAVSRYGIDVIPGDLDITPARDSANLEQLAAFLLTIEAMPEQTGGHWETGSNGERKWVEEELTAEMRARAIEWRPDPSNVTSMDHLFISRYGNVDIVPDVAGSYEWLMERAVPMNIEGYEVWVAHVDDLLATLTIPRRKKDIARVQALRAIQRQQGRHPLA